jgi:hypothetical protein
VGATVGSDLLVADADGDADGVDAVGAGASEDVGLADADGTRPTEPADAAGDSGAVEVGEAAPQAVTSSPTRISRRARLTSTAAF